jgi:phage tail sheath protein FI
MAVNLTYPGVYVQEIPSGVRTITGVSTAVAAFIGQTRRGPINDPVTIQSFADFEREFGGLDAGSEVSYAVRQFFLNGGSQAVVVRVARNPLAAERTLQNADGDDVLRILASSQGAAGNLIQVRVDHATANPASTFNLTLSREIAGDPAGSLVESFANLSMNSGDLRFVQDVVNGESRLAQVERVVDAATLAGLPAATSTSAPLVDANGNLLDVATLIDDRHNQLQVAVNGNPAVTVQVSAASDATGADEAARLASLCAAIQAQVRAAAEGDQALADFTCAPVGTSIRMTSGRGGEASSVRVLRGIRNDLAAALRLGPDNGGVEVAGVAALRPAVQPEPATLTSDAFAHADIDAIDPNNNAFQISLDGGPARTITVGLAGLPPEAGNSVDERLGVVAARIQTTVRAADPSRPAYSNFRAEATGGRLLLRSGTAGAGSTIAVSPAAAADASTQLRLVGAGVTTTRPQNVMLEGGNEEPFGEDEAYGIFIGSRSEREGIFALEDTDIFNLMLLPGISDAGILTDAIAYCQERRAFLIVDPPRGLRPAEMLETALGLPKSNYGAVYYPWVYIADPLKGGQLRLTPPGASVAGVFARTDANRGVWKAPAGTEATLLGVQKLEYVLTDGENGLLNPQGINSLRTFAATGRVVWGARTLRGANDLADEYKYVPVRRLALFIEESLFRGTQWVVFEPNDEPLWAQIRLNVGAFMQSLFRQGAFQGRTPQEAYLVKVDRETTTQYDIDRGVVNILVGFAPLKPAEFILLMIQQLARQTQ